MAISNYSELVTAIYKWLVKDSNDPFLTASAVDNVIALAESELSRRLNVRQLRATSSLALTAGTATVTAPTDLQRVVAVYGVNLAEIQPADQGTFIRLELASYSGNPIYYDLNGTQFIFGPIPDSNYTLILDYIRKVPALSSGAPTNAILTAFPDLYLGACLKQAYILLQDDANADKTEARLERLLNDVNKQATLNKVAANTRGKAKSI